MSVASLPPNSRPRRRIQSFVRREGRMSDAQRRALKEVLPRYEIAAHTSADFSAAFGRTAPVVLEIGFGNGDALLAAARDNPDLDFVGIEVHRPGAGRVCLTLAQEPLPNIRLVIADAAEWLVHQVPDASIDEVRIFFPDPWPKKRHHKRRLIQPPFVAKLRDNIVIGGLIRLATDWDDYAQQMLQVLSATPGLRNEADGFAPRFAGRPQTRFERRGTLAGHHTWDLSFRRIA